MRCGVVVFPGSNCDHDVYHVLKHILGQEVVFLWHGNENLKECELVVLPGGFSYGDYLRAGALAAQSPIMSSVRQHAADGGLVLGICNGFQMLLETDLLPGAMRRNRNLRFECRDVFLTVERDDLAFTKAYQTGQVLRMPIAHSEGNYFASEETLQELEAEGRVVFRYTSPEGGPPDDESPWNINGSMGSIAGICSAKGNVLGLMPHPERCAESVLGNEDGLGLFAAAVGQLAESGGVA